MVNLFSRRSRAANSHATWTSGNGLRPEVDEYGRTARSLAKPQPALPNSADWDIIQLRYGHWTVGPTVRLDVAECEDLVSLAGEQIKRRGLDQPLLFSTRALDLDSDDVAALIRSYLSNPREWRSDIQFANVHNLAAMIKWALGRLINTRGGRGVLLYDIFQRWRLGERESGYRPRYISTQLLQHLPIATAKLLQTLLTLMVAAVAYSVKNGTTTRKLACVFSSYIFGLPDDQPFVATYNAYLRYSQATEHLLLAYIRDQKEGDHHMPTNLVKCIADYPSIVETTDDRPPPTAQLQQVVRIMRSVRFQSQDLIQSASTWEIPGSSNWDSIARPREGRATSIFSDQYRQLLNLDEVGR